VWKWTLLAGLGSTLFMTGLVVFVHVVHYPLFGRVEVGSFPRYHADHSRLTTLVVFPPMVVELLTALALVAGRPPGSPPWLTWASLAAALTTWVLTGLVSVPLHGRLTGGFDPDAHRALVATNALRVVAWVGHSATLLAMTARALRD